MDKVKVIISLFAMGMAMSCQNKPEFQAELQTVDSLQKVLNEYSQEFNSVDAKTVIENYEVVTSQYDFLIHNYKDTSDREFWITDVNTLRGIKKSFGRFAEGHQSLQEEIDISAHQLKTLENTLQEIDTLTKEEAAKYVQDEGHAVQKIGFHVNKIVPGTKMASERWPVLKPHYDSIATFVHNSQ